jgi:hypothetical protein
MKLGQRAMVAAKVREVTGKLSLRETARIANVDRETQRQAALVLLYRPDLAELVISGAMSLNDAWEKARETQEGDGGRHGLSSALRINSTRHSSAVMPSARASALSLSAFFSVSIRSKSFAPATGIRKSIFRGMPITSGGIGLIRSAFLSWGIGRFLGRSVRDRYRGTKRPGET